MGPAAVRIVLAAAAAAFAARAQTAPAPAPASRPAPRDVSALIAPLTARHGVPGLVAATVEGPELVALGAAGVRRRGGDATVRVDDPFHLGSCTKAMTATLCGLLVEEGKLSWSTTLADVFSAPLGDALGAPWREVALTQLLTNTSGMPANLDQDGLWGALCRHRGAPLEGRRKLLTGVVKHAPVAPPGSKNLYSNAGFATAGHMAETVVGEPWEALMARRLFGPLGMTRAGFGAPTAASADDVPWGHRDDGTPVDPSKGGADNPAAIGPAGTVHAPIGDWAKFVALHLRGARGEAGLALKPGTFATLHRPAEASGASYAMGWVVAKRPWAGGRTLMHNGSNTMWFAVVWIAPEKNFAVMAACNQGGDAGAKATDDAVGALIRERGAR
ncbi:MAG TPA: serine hydrolase domain-containing protein [Planctomycetota bacterium]|nr:serine hydrolase domain-containing protein [Planctomycetota bacterium]